MPGHYDKGLGTAVQATVPLKALTTDGAGTAICTASTDLSMMNNRLYRQTRLYRLKFNMIGVPVSDSSDNSVFDFFTLPDTWFVRGAVRHAYQVYQSCMADELAAGIKFARWHDFMINEQNVDAVYDYLKASMWDGDGWATLTADESITDSSVTDAGGTSQGFHIIGNLANSFNIFREYAKKLNYQHATDPSVSSDQPYDGLLDIDDADVMAERGDRPPYDQDFSSMIPDDTVVDDAQGQHLLVHQACLSFDSITSSARTSTGYFDAPLGLVWIRRSFNGTLTDLSTTNAEISFTAAPGSYKGVKAPSLV